MFERFTDRARRVIVLAQNEARMLNHSYIGTEHILLGLIHEGEGVAAKALESLGISLAAVRQEVEEIIGHGTTPPKGHIPFTPRAKKVLELSLREGLQMGHKYIGTEFLLLGLIREGEGVAAQVLVKLGAGYPTAVGLRGQRRLSRGRRLRRYRRCRLRLPNHGRSRVLRWSGRTLQLLGSRPVWPQPHPSRQGRQARPSGGSRKGN